MTRATFDRLYALRNTTVPRGDVPREVMRAIKFAAIGVRAARRREGLGAR